MCPTLSQLYFTFFFLRKNKIFILKIKDLSLSLAMDERDNNIAHTHTYVYTVRRHGYINQQQLVPLASENTHTRTH